MSERSQQVLLREMILDLHYRLRLADELFCDAAESLVSAAALEDWNSRSEALRKIGEYSRALQVIHQDRCRITEGKKAVFPAELPEWVFELPEGEVTARLHLERLHTIAAGLELALNRELLRMEFSHE
ncbi:MAG: hypothetical protein IJT50_07885 [Lentisphaeria bacterium]|nr:hypothetical protein [Lentisphaeria bacterium]